MTVYYLCDRRACEVCTPDCTHTSDITHAKNFTRESDAIVFECYVPSVYTTKLPISKEKRINRK